MYNKEFTVVSLATTDHKAVIELDYSETNKNIGFPFTYHIGLTYTFIENSVRLSIDITNTDDKDFPFTLGWHPYFTSENLAKSSLNFNCKQKIIIGNRNITSGTTDVNEIINFNIKDKQLDNCWALNSDKIVFKTPTYQLNFSSTEKDSFLQAYTPPRKNTIAIEPTTGVSDSLNNKIGLKELKSNNKYSITFNLEIDNL